MANLQLIINYTPNGGITTAPTKAGQVLKIILDNQPDGTLVSAIPPGDSSLGQAPLSSSFIPYALLSDTSGTPYIDYSILLSDLGTRMIPISFSTNSTSTSTLASYLAFSLNTSKLNSLFSVCRIVDSDSADGSTNVGAGININLLTITSFLSGNTTVNPCSVFDTGAGSNPNKVKF